jgi:hypothetical protein
MFTDSGLIHVLTGYFALKLIVFPIFAFIFGWIFDKVSFKNNKRAPKILEYQKAHIFA